MGQQPGGRQGHGHGGQDEKGQGGCGCQGGGCGSRQDEEQGDHGEQGGQPSVAGQEGIGEDGDEPLPGGVDDPAAGDAHGVAAQAHGHGEALFAAGAAFLESPVHVEGGPGQVSQVLQQGEQGKEDGHGGQHDGDHPGQNPVDAEHQAVHGSGGDAQGAEDGGQGLLGGEQEVPQQPGRVVCAGHGQPEDAEEEEEHDQGTQDGACDQAVDDFLPAAVIGAGEADGLGGQLSGGEIQAVIAEALAGGLPDDLAQMVQILL